VFDLLWTTLIAIARLVNALLPANYVADQATLAWVLAAVTEEAGRLLDAAATSLPRQPEPAP
jgi:hypothetical protein